MSEFSGLRKYQNNSACTESVKSLSTFGVTLLNAEENTPYNPVCTNLVTVKSLQTVGHYGMKNLTFLPVALSEPYFTLIQPDILIAFQWFHYHLTPQYSVYFSPEKSPQSRQMDNRAPNVL